MSEVIRYASVCSGIGAAELAWSRLGWRCAWSSEIDPFACAVLAARHSGVPNLGDMTRIDAGTAEREHGSIDVLVGGTPCQSFSVAGLRGGLADPRGNLALVYLGLADRLRPEWLVWENVPGVLSSRGGRDFGTFVGAMGELGYGWAYRVLDAQYFGVAQRRRRVFALGYLGDWRRAASVLFEPASMRGDPAPSREAGAVVASALTQGLGRGGADAGRAQAGWYIPEVARTLSPGAHRGGATGHDAYPGVLVETTHTLTASHASEDGTGRGTPLVPMVMAHGQAGAEVVADASPTLTCNHEAPICFSLSVRRLTPRECERLQGFPDDYTAIEYRRKPAKDSPRYRALGNSMAVPVMEWIGRRIQQEGTR